MNTDFFGDQARFMRACGQTVGVSNDEQCAMYEELLDEEVGERIHAVYTRDDKEEFDADLDILVVHIGRMLSRWNPNMIKAGWDEVMRSNMSKLTECEHCHDGMANESQLCGHCTGIGFTAIKRDDGKILKPETYSPPDLAKIMRSFGYDT